MKASPVLLAKFPKERKLHVRSLLLKIVVDLTLPFSLSRAL